MSLFNLARGGIKFVKGVDRKAIDVAERLFGESKARRKMVEASLPQNASLKQKIAAADAMRFGKDGSRSNAAAVARMGYGTAAGAAVGLASQRNNKSKKSSTTTTPKKTGTTTFGRVGANVVPLPKKRVTPKPTAPKPITSKATTPKPITAKPTAKKKTAPKPTAKKPTAKKKTAKVSRRGMTAGERAKQAGKERSSKPTKKKTGYVSGSAFKKRRKGLK